MPNQKRMKLCVELNCKMEHENWFQSCFFWMWLLCLLQMVLRFCVTICGTKSLSDLLHVFFLQSYLWFVLWGLRIIDCHDIWISSAPSYSKITIKYRFIWNSGSESVRLRVKSNLKNIKSLSLPQTVYNVRYSLQCPFNDVSASLMGTVFYSYWLYGHNPSFQFFFQFKITFRRLDSASALG